MPERRSLTKLGHFDFMQKILSLVLLVGVCAVSGCAAIGSRIVGWGYFQGVRCDYNEMFRRDTIDPQCRIHLALAAVDMPFSFVGDRGGPHPLDRKTQKLS
jgi:uncharacterized protein YceK